MLKALKRYKVLYLLIMPFFVLFLVSQLVPIIWTLYISLTNWEGVGTPDFYKFDNYRKMLIDDMFQESLGNTVVCWLIGLVFIICCALLVASLLNSRYLKSNSARVFFKTATFLPNICAAIAVGLIFRILLDENVGLVNEVVTVFGGGKVPWFASTIFSKIPVIILNVWRCTPWFTMILLSGLLSTSKDYYEAIMVNGTSGWRQFWFITLSSLRNIPFFCSVTLTVDMWKLFNKSYILPGPGTSNSFLFRHMCESGFSIFNMGYASTIGVILVLILIVISIIQFAIRHKQGEIQKEGIK